MNQRILVSVSILTVLISGVLLATILVAAQAPSGTPAAAAAKAATTWTLSRTPDGQPDLQGYWTNLSFTPLERPAKYAGKEFFTDEELAEEFKRGVQHSYDFTFQNSAETPVYDGTVYALDAWQNGIKPNRRTSLIKDPADGKIPPRTPETQKRATERAAARRGRGPADRPEDLGLGVRCFSFQNAGPPMLPGNYNSNYLIVQAPGYVMITYEWNSEVRIIPLDGRPPLSQNIRRWHGDSRGRWEGNTLVVETTNFRPEGTYQDANPETLRMVERFTRVDADSINYEFTVNDPTTWTRPWTVEVPLNKIEGPMFEYACSEGNNSLINILQGARAAEKAAAKEAR